MLGYITILFPKERQLVGNILAKKIFLHEADFHLGRKLITD